MSARPPSGVTCSGGGRGLPPGRGVGAGVKVGDFPEYAGHNDLGTAALLAAMHGAGVGRLVLASPMVVYGVGRYACEQHGAQAPARDFARVLS